MTKPRFDLIIDYETLGKKVQSCPIVDCAKFVFDWSRFGDTPYTLTEIVESCDYFKVSVEDQVKKHGYAIEPDALEFWNKQPKEVRARIKPAIDDISLESYVEQTIVFFEHSEKISYWWSRANVFDPPILKVAFDTVGRSEDLDQYLKFWKVRDIRTYIDAKFDFKTRNDFIPVSDHDFWNETFRQHDCRFDIAADVLRLQAIYRAENELPQTNR